VNFAEQKINLFFIICLYISMSNISKKFKDKIVKAFKLENYKSLVKSAELIKRFLIGFSLIDSII